MLELLPFSRDQDCIGCKNGLCRGCVFDIREEGGKVLHSKRVEGNDLSSGIEQRPDDRDGPALPDIIRVGFECQAQNANSSALEVWDVSLEQPDQLQWLAFVDPQCCMDDLQMLAIVTCTSDQGPDILGETRAAKSDPGPEEGRANPAVEPDPGKDLLRIDPKSLCQIADLVCEADLCCKEGIARLLDHLRSPD